MKYIISLTLVVCNFTAILAKTTNFKQLYKKAYNIAATHPDSAMYYAQLAIKATTKPKEKASAHDLWGFYASRQGYYSLAIEHYQQAYNLYPEPIKKTMMLDNLAFCYKNIGQVASAIPIAQKAVLRFSQIEDSVRVAESLYFLGSCYLDEYNFKAADSTLQLMLQIGEKLNHHKLGLFYSSYAYYQEKRNRFDSAVYYQKLAIQKYKGKNLAKKSIWQTRLSRYYLQAQNPNAAQNALHKAKQLAGKLPLALLYYHSIQGIFLFLDQQDQAAYDNYKKCDSLLKKICPDPVNLTQRKYVRKKSYEIYKIGYDIFRKIWSYEDKERYTRIRQWYQDRMHYEKALYDNIKISVALKDSLAMERARLKVQVKRTVNPWWWWVMVAVIGVFGGVAYWQRTRKLRAEQAFAKASTDFVKAIKASPIRGYGEPRPEDMLLLGDIEDRQRKKLTSDEAKILLMIRRGDSYNKIHLATEIPVGTIKSTVRRIKEQCRVENIRDLM